MSAAPAAPDGRGSPRSTPGNVIFGLVGGLGRRLQKKFANRLVEVDTRGDFNYSPASSFDFARFGSWTAKPRSDARQDRARRPKVSAGCIFSESTP